ncbi:MAG: amino acid adenylation domain-containing protein [Streptosporangiaceae bacterium]|nr:amino acid adenylation domain-containing protein [Streptosporangiaceae bacterium]
MGELDELLALGCGEPLPVAGRCSVPEMVAAVARRHPSRTAVVGRGQSIDYGTLDAWAAGIATRLAAAGIGRGHHVGLVAEPSPAAAAAALAILRRGGAYVPVDGAQPDQRIAGMLSDARVAGVVVTSETRDRIVRLSDRVIVEADTPQTLSVGLATVPVTAADAAYLIYTSGSTGEPKGVLVGHGQLTASTLARRLVYPDAPVFLLVSPLAFDSSVAGLWGTLCAGGRLVVASAAEVRDPERLVMLVARHSVTRMLCIPSLYGTVLDAAERIGIGRLRSLETVIVAGEPVQQELLDRHFALRPGRALVNEYGPTEATVWASYRRYDAPGPVSIGGPVPGTRLYVLDDDLRPVRRGVEGELFIGGEGVARGYFGRPEETVRAFLRDPFATVEHGRMYRTGDRVCWDEEGMLDFRGRRDRQVKIRGHRVELGAVEAALRALPQVRDAVVVTGQTRHLEAFVIAAPAATAADLRARLATQVLPAMLPARIHLVEEFPRSVNGKTDHRALAAMARETTPTPALTPAAPLPGDNPSDDMQALVSAAWREILKTTEVPADVNFFDLGGHSLRMFELQDALEASTGVRPSIVALFRHTTVSAQTKLLRELRVAADGGSAGGTASAHRGAAAPIARSLGCPMPRPEAQLRLICFPHAGGSASFFRDWGECLPDIEVHAVRYPGRGERIDEPTPTDLHELAGEIAAAAEPLTDRRLALFGHSMGAAVAFEAARELERRGVSVAHLFVSGSRDDTRPMDLGGPDDEDAVAEQLLALGGTDPELAADPEFIELVLPYVRADGRMFHAYRMEPEPRLRCPVTAIVGDSDGDADRRPWRHLTEGGFAQHVVRGDHFYLTADPPSGLIRRYLRHDRGE